MEIGTIDGLQMLVGESIQKEEANAKYAKKADNSLDFVNFNIKKYSPIEVARLNSENTMATKVGLPLETKTGIESK